MRTFKQYHNELTRKKKFVAQEYIFSTLSLIFVKTGHKKVSVYERFYGCLRTDPVVSLYEKYFKLHYWPLQGYSLYNHMRHFAKIRYKTVGQNELVVFADGTRSIFFPGMKVTYGGQPVQPYPKKRQQETQVVLEEIRERKNAMQRLYYHRKKSAERFEAAAEYTQLLPVYPDVTQQLVHVDVSKLPMDDVFKLQNVSQRKYLIDYYGMDAILAGLETEVLDKDVINGNPYELVTVKIPFSQISVEEEEIGTYLRMVNPSTDEIHFEGVPNYDHELARSREKAEREETILIPTVKAALAWRDGETRYRVPIKLT